MSIVNANRHADLSRRLMAQANYELHTMGDRVQASEKASGAVAHAVKAIGEDRNWRNRSHNLRREIVVLLASEFDLPDLVNLQGIADQLHDNHYKDRMSDVVVAYLVGQINDRIGVLWNLRETGANPEFSPTPEQQRVIDRLLIPEDVAQADESIDFPPPMPPFNPPTG